MNTGESRDGEKFNLFHFPGTCSRVVLAALVASRAEFAVTVPPLHLGPDSRLRALNPFGQVPTLLIEGEVITESVAIVDRLDRLFPQRGILPTAEHERSACFSGIAFCSSQLHPVLSRISFPSKCCDVSPESEARVQALAREHMAERLAEIESDLEDGDWWRSAAPSMADHFLGWFSGKLNRLQIETSDFPRIARHHARLRDDPIHQEVMRREESFVAELEAGFGPLEEPMRSRLVS